MFKSLLFISKFFIQNWILIWKISFQLDWLKPIKICWKNYILIENHVVEKYVTKWFILQYIFSFVRRIQNWKEKGQTVWPVPVGNWTPRPQNNLGKTKEQFVVIFWLTCGKKTSLFKKKTWTTFNFLFEIVNLTCISVNFLMHLWPWTMLHTSNGK